MNFFEALRKLSPEIADWVEKSRDEIELDECEYRGCACCGEQMPRELLDDGYCLDCFTKSLEARYSDHDDYLRWRAL